MTDKPFRPVRSRVFWLGLSVTWAVTLFLPIIPVYKGGTEPAFYWPLGAAYLAVFSTPAWWGGLVWVVGHLFVCAFLGSCIAYRAHLREQIRSR